MIIALKMVVALSTTSVKDMEYQLHSAIDKSKHVGLKLNKGQTKLIINFVTSEEFARGTSDRES